MQEKGFTLFELIICVAILAILSSIAIPGFIAWRNAAAVRSVAYNLKADLERAKWVAMKKADIVRVDFSESGYSVYCDLDKNSRMDEGEKEFSVELKGVLIDMDETRFANVKYARFNSRGMLYSSLGGSIAIGSGIHKKTLIVDRLGRVRIS